MPSIKNTLCKYFDDFIVSMVTDGDDMDLDFMIRAARYDYAMCFKKAYNDIFNMKVLLSENGRVVEMLLDAAVLNNSIRVLREIYKWRSCLLISRPAYTRALCHALTNCDSKQSREVFDIMFGPDGENAKRHTMVTFHDRTGPLLYDELIIAASKAETRWGLDTLFKVVPERFTHLSSDSLLQHIRDNNLEMVKAMIEYGFDIHVEDDAALSVASRNCNPEIIGVLLKNGAKISGHGYKALRKAIINADAKVMQLYALSAWDALEKDVPIDLAIKFIKKTLTFKESGINHNGLTVKLLRLRTRKEEGEVG